MYEEKSNECFTSISCKVKKIEYPNLITYKIEIMHFSYIYNLICIPHNEHLHGEHFSRMNMNAKKVKEDGKPPSKWKSSCDTVQVIKK